MDNQNGKSPLLALTVATMLFAALGVMVYTQAPYKGIRPSVQDIPEAPHKIRARLWQDPFQAVLDYETKRLAGVKPVEEKDRPVWGSDCPRELEDRDFFYLSPCQGTTLEKEFEGKKQVTILAVMVPGGPYDDDIEDRIRRRYAVLSALNVLEYYPVDPTHIKYLNICSSSTDNHLKNNKISCENIIPFEWLSSSYDNKSVLLLWLNDDIFQEKPINKLINLRKYLKEEFPFKIIGPYTSTTLLKMVEENRSIEEKDNIPKLAIYSASATVDDDYLIQFANKKSAFCIKPETFLKSGNVVRTIITDRRLAEAMSAELKNRSITSGNHIVLIAEWDTEYGRSILQTFGEVFKKDIYKNQNVENRIHRFCYLRGIDGKLPGEQDGSDKDKKKNENSQKEERDVKKLEEPIGKSQYDYLRRLTARISHIKDTYGSIGAIGVLGNDFYDKFLVLQALQQRFPESIFFTTDLDARYLHPANIEWTRNLVVASSFGLQLREDLQKDVPPFRNVYQTSVFFATLRAFYNGIDSNNPLKSADVTGTINPRIFEIGRSNAIDLSNEAGSYVPINQAFAVKGFPYLVLVGFIVVMLGISILAMSMRTSWLSYNSGQGVMDGYKQSYHETIHIPWFTDPKNVILVWVTILVISLVILIGIHTIITISSSEEPYSWSEGISVWPTEIIRFIAFILAVAFIYLSKGQLENNMKSIYKDFGLEFNSKNNQNSEPPDHTIQKTINVNNNWQDYLSGSSISKRWKWILLVSISYYVVCFIIIVLSGFPNNPVRGNFSWWLNFILLLFITIPAFILLTFYVFDTIMLCRYFINQFIQNQPQWNLDSLDQFVKKWAKEPGPSSEDSHSSPKDSYRWQENIRIKAALSEWMLVLLIARRTDVVGKLIFYPFIVWSLIIISRLHYFDNWRAPLGLVIVISLSAVLAWVYAVNLRRSAEKLRTAVINRLDHLLVGTYVTEPDNKNDKCIKYVLDEVKAIKTGAFASYLQQPALQSLLVPIGGISGLKILELLSNLG